MEIIILFNTLMRFSFLKSTPALYNLHYMLEKFVTVVLWKSFITVLRKIRYHKYIYSWWLTQIFHLWCDTVYGKYFYNQLQTYLYVLFSEINLILFLYYQKFNQITFQYFLYFYVRKQFSFRFINPTKNKLYYPIYNKNNVY